MIIPYQGKTPQIGKNCFIAETAVLIGDVRLGDNCNIWYGAVLRGDMAPIILGESCNVQDNCVVHVNLGTPTVLGKRVSVGHGAIVHGATVEDNCLIGMGAVLMDNCRIGRGSVVGAGALVTENKQFPPCSLSIGTPAKVVSELPAEMEKDRIEHADYYAQLAKEYMQGE